jgi:hypothetical protein
MTASQPHGEAALRDLVLQTARSGAQRRAVMLHTERLPACLGRPHHIRLAREALSGLAASDRAQTFDLSQGRRVIVWRGAAAAELDKARVALAQLLAGQPDGQTPGAADLLTAYDLPEQAPCLLDELADARPEPPRAVPSRPLDAPLLAMLEAALAQADLSGFARWRPVMRLDGTAPPVAWEERYFDMEAIAASLCPEVAIQADPWLFLRLTRTLDRRMLALLAAPRELRGHGAFAIHLNTDTILSADFLRLDEALPLALRGQVILNLRVVDLLADPAAFTFARRFAQSRGYRIALTGTTGGHLPCLDLAAACLDYVHLACTAPVRQAPGATVGLVPAATRLVATGLDRPSLVQWARQAGFPLGRGAAISG